MSEMVDTMWRSRVGPLAVLVALSLVAVAVPSSALGHRVVATGQVDGTQKVRGCSVQADVAFVVDLSSGDGRLELLQYSGDLACVLGFENVHWVNYCREDADGRIVCGDDKLSTEETDTAFLWPDGGFSFEDELWRLNGTLLRTPAT